MSQPIFEKIFPTDVLSKRERVERTLNLQSVDRVALHDQLSFNAGVLALYTGKPLTNFNYTYEDICAVIRKTLDACFPPVAPRGTARITNDDEFVLQYDNWNVSIVKRPFQDVDGAREYLLRKTDVMVDNQYIPEQDREEYHCSIQRLQKLIGDTVIIDYPIDTGFCTCWSNLGLELFIYLYDAEPQVITDYLDAYVAKELLRLHAIADPTLSPVVLIAEDFASKRAPIFSPTFLRKELFPRLSQITAAWHSHGFKVLFHSDGNWKRVIPDLVACGVDGFYCLEPAIGMDIVELKNTWPAHVWAGGVDGVDLMERGTPAQVRDEVHRQIRETKALHTGGLFIDSSSEINPPIKPENYKAMVDAVGDIFNSDFNK